MDIVQERDNNSTLTASVTRGGNIGGILARTTPGLRETTLPTQEATLDGAAMARATTRLRPVSLERGGARRASRGASRGGSARLQSAVWSGEPSRGEPSRAKVRLVALATAGGPTTSFYAYDMQGNVTTLTDTAGNVVGSYAYDAWGNTVAISGARAGENPYRFSTKEQLGGLYHFGYRFYDAGNGRWLNRDPLEENGGVNLYMGMGNDPINRLDQYGLIVETGWDVLNVTWDVISIGKNVSTGNWGGAALSAGALLYDGAATAIPGLPGGAGALLRSASAVSALSSPAIPVTPSFCPARINTNSLDEDASPDEFQKNRGPQRKPGKRGQFKSADGLKAENEMAAAALKAVGRGGDNVARDLLHKRITGNDFSYREILNIAKELFNR